MLHSNDDMMATAMESPMAFPDSPMDPDDAAYPCKGCGQVRIPRRSVLARHTLTFFQDPRRRQGIRARYCSMWPLRNGTFFADFSQLATDGISTVFAAILVVPSSIPTQTSSSSAMGL